MSVITWMGGKPAVKVLGAPKTYVYPKDSMDFAWEKALSNMEYWIDKTSTVQKDSVIKKVCVERTLDQISSYEKWVEGTRVVVSVKVPVKVTMCEDRVE